MQNNKKNLLNSKIEQNNSKVSVLRQALLKERDLTEKLRLQRDIDSVLAETVELEIDLSRVGQEEIKSIQDKLQGTARFRKG